jgi:hypothetical protein
MADSVWFYARGEVERGPFTLTQIRALANASKLRPDDLVWKEGMDNWTVARDVAELFPPADLIGGDASGGENLGTSPTGKAEGMTAAAAPVAGLSRETREAIQRVGRALTALGILLILGTHGCESLSARRVARLAAVADLAALENSTANEEEKRGAEKAALEHQASAMARGVALQIGLFVLLIGAAGLMIFADRYERWLGVGVILVEILVVLHALTIGGPAGPL